MDSLILQRTKSLVEEPSHSGLDSYYKQKIEEIEIRLIDKRNNVRRLEAQVEDMNTKVKNIKDEL